MEVDMYNRLILAPYQNAFGIDTHKSQWNKQIFKTMYLYNSEDY